MTGTSSRKAGFSYFLREGVRGIFVHGFMSFAAITVIAACLLITATFSLVAYNVDLLIRGLESQSEIIVYIDDSVSREDAVALGEQIRTLDNVESAEFVSKEQAFDEYLQSLGDDAYVMEGLRDDNPLRDSYRVTMKDVSKHGETVTELENISGVASSSSSKEVSDRLIQIRRVTHLISYTLVALLGGVGIFIISNTVKLAMFARREEIAIMKMVGATNHFIRAPFVVEGILLGLCASGLAFFCQWGIYRYISGELSSSTAVLTMLPFAVFWKPLAFILLAAGLALGIGGSVITIRKFLKV
ncbi:MAG: permease-like cell division protein FtsX [Clostridiaceae bacterium]|nr:permease-like cell division protein FtsX [Clostridiaceae bacterium]